MSITQYEKQQIIAAYNSGEISREEYVKLLNDITPMLWEEWLWVKINKNIIFK